MSGNRYRKSLAKQSIKTSPEWRRYQNDVANVFREFGFSAVVQAKVLGARATHEVDVFVEFYRWGLHHRWIVECKLKKRPVTKAEVEALKSIVADVGADRGLLVCGSGFQPGAVAAARLTNITLTSLQTLRSEAEPDLLKEAFSLFEERALKLHDLLSDFTYTVDNPIAREGIISLTIHVKSGVDSQYHSQSGKITLLIMSLLQIKLGQYPAIVSYNSSPKETVWAYNVRDYIEKALEVIVEVEAWASQQKPKEPKGSREKGPA